VLAAAGQGSGLGKSGPQGPGRLKVSVAVGWAGVVGLLLGGCILARPTALPWAALVCLSPCVFRCGRPLRWQCVGAATLAVVVVILPWGLRNAVQLGQFTVTTTHGGYTLLLANNPSLYRHISRHGWDRGWDAEPFHQRWAARDSGDPRLESFWFQPTANAQHAPAQPADSQVPEADDASRATQLPEADELAEDRLANAAAMATILRQPGMFLKSALVRVSWLWAIAPHPPDSDAQQSGRSRAARAAIGLWYALWFGAAAAGAVSKLCGRRQLVAWMAPLTLVLTLTMVHAVYWSNMRMRTPLMPIIYVLALPARRTLS
jgi:hypothetical protein